MDQGIDAGTRVKPGSDLYAEVADLLLCEADALDNYRYDEWLGMLTEDMTYVMPVRTSQFLTDGKGFHGDANFFSDDRESLTTRVRRLETEFAWAETPPSRTRHFISNVLVREREDGELGVRSSFMLTRTRQDHGYQMFTGERQDRLRRGEDGELRFAGRVVLPDQTVITATNLSVIF
ncbi:MAG: aromatic-ring-hydroxylating dioxygenase subunit beta [Actinobacteria bacterium]|nr:aromatic-ring-hydroxylating dioxygenase subunit beta [Actinomycetota bacterium]